MLKKFKLAVVSLCCILSLTSCLAFSGCNSANAITPSVTGFSYSKGSYSIKYEFTVKNLEDGKYSLVYTLKMTETAGWSSTEREGIIFTVSGQSTYKVSGSIYPDNIDMINKVECYDFKLTPIYGDRGDDFMWLTVSFGILAALLLGGAITLFVLDKKGKTNKLK